MFVFGFRLLRVSFPSIGVKAMFPSPKAGAEFDPSTDDGALPFSLPSTDDLSSFSLSRIL